jgi:hypothetical protein
MSNSDGSHSCQHITQELTQNDPDDPEPRHLYFATCDVIGRRFIRG